MTIRVLKQMGTMILAAVVFSSCAESKPGNESAYQPNSSNCSDVFINDHNTVAMAFRTMRTEADLNRVASLVQDFDAKYHDVACVAKPQDSNHLDSTPTTINVNEKVALWKSAIASIRGEASKPAPFVPAQAAPAPAASTPIAALPADESKVLGTWISPCQETQSGSYQNRVVFQADGKATHADLNYLGSGCMGTPRVETMVTPYQILSETAESAIFQMEIQNAQAGQPIVMVAEFKFQGADQATLKVQSLKIMSGGEGTQVPSEEIAKIPTIAYKRQ